MTVAITAPLTPKSDINPHVVKLKVFWKTTRKWTDADVADYQRSVPQVAEQMRTEQYWDRSGNERTNRFTCEDFALRVLIQYAAPKGLPIRLTNGVRTYRNMEIYRQTEHDKYDSTIYGFADMIESTYGAPDMQRSGINTQLLSGPDGLLPGDILAEAYDRAGIAHHVQIVIKTTADSISVMQGNSSGAIVRPFTTVSRLLGMNRADPENRHYAGMSPELGTYRRNKDGWDYKNITTGRKTSDFLKEFQFYRWNFLEFDK
jgi:hypothetical protein